MREQVLRELPEDAVQITDDIAAVIDRNLDWRVYGKLRDGWRLIDVKPTLRAVRRQYSPDDFEPNPPSLYRAVIVDTAGHRHPLGSGPLSVMREKAMATWLGDPTVKSAYVVDAVGDSYLTLEPKDRHRLAANGGGEVDWRVYDRSMPMPEEGWAEIGRFDTGWRAFNKMIETQMRALGNTAARVEIMPSRSRPGKISYGVFVKYIDGEKQPLEFWESQYVRSMEPNPGRLSAAARKKLPASVFVFPSRRAWPIESAKAAHAAIQHLQMGHVKNASEYLAIMNFIRDRYPAVWKKYGHGLSWTKSKTAKAKARTSRSRTSKRGRRRTSKAA